MNLNSKQKFLELSKRYSTLIIIIFLTVLFTAARTSCGAVERSIFEIYDIAGLLFMQNKPIT